MFSFSTRGAATWYGICLICIAFFALVELPAAAQEVCSTCKTCGTGAKYSRPIPLPGGLGNMMDFDCGDCNISGQAFCETEASIRTDANRRILLARQLGPNDVRIRRGIGGRRNILGTVSLDLPPAGMIEEALVDFRVATSAGVCRTTSDIALAIEEQG